VNDTEVLDLAEQVIGYRFKDRNLLVAALTHASIADHRLQSNERLEFLGDAILGFIVCQELYERFPDLLEGELTKIKSTVVSRKTCADVSRELELPRLLFLGKGMRGRTRLPSSLAAAVFESLIAAVVLDGGGIEEARRFVLKHMGSRITEAAESEHKRNYKSQLQQYAQKVLNSTPVYELLDEQGPDHSKCFEVCVAVQGRRFPSAWGPAKKEAEQKAAYYALRELHVLREEDASIDALEQPDADEMEESDDDEGAADATAPEAAPSYEPQNHVQESPAG
jgi:ribonuclease-3